MLSIDNSAALEIPGVVAVFTPEDAPAQLFSTAQHELYTDDPDDTRLLDDVVRFRGQRVAAVVAESVGAAEAGVRALKVKYQLLPAVFTPAGRHAARGARPSTADKDGGHGADCRPEQNIVAELHSELGSVEDGFAAADFIHEQTYRTQRVQHVALETHSSIASVDDAGRLHIRTSSQVPFLVRRTLCRLFGLPEERIHVVSGRVGGGFGGKQEVLTEDIVALAALKLKRPVQLEFTRTEQFTASTTRHPFTIKLKAGASSDGRLTALQLEVLTNTGAYGNHAPGVMFHGCGESLGVYKCANKKVDAQAVYTNTVPSGAFRGYGLSQMIFAIESGIDELATGIGMDPLEFRRRNMVREGDDMLSTHAEPEEDVHYGSYGLDQCTRLVQDALDRGRERYRAAGLDDLGPDWVTGEGTALSMIDTVPPRGHFAHSKLRLLPDGTYAADVGTAEFGNGTTTVHAQLAATALSTSAARVAVRQSDTDLVEHDTGAFGSAGTVVAGKATLAAAEELAVRIRAFAAGIRQIQSSGCVLDGDAVVCEGTRVPLTELSDAAAAGRRRTCRRGALGRHAALGGVQRPRFPRGREHRDGGAADPAERAGGRRRRGGQSAAVPRPDRGRDRAGAGRRAVRGGQGGRRRPGHHGHPAAVPHPLLRRRAAQRGVLRRHQRQTGPAGREVDERKPVQPGGAGAGQRHPERHRRAVRRAAHRPGQDLPGPEGSDAACGGHVLPVPKATRGHLAPNEPRRRGANDPAWVPVI